MTSKCKPEYDYIFIGIGLTNAVIADYLCEHISTKRKPLRILMLDQRDHIAGNCYTEKVNGIDVHKYGAHIFHTDDEWLATEYLPKYGKWHSFINSPIAIATVPYQNGMIEAAYNLPFNMNTFARLFSNKGLNCTTPADAQCIIDHEKTHYINPKNLKEQALNLVGKTIFETLIEGYTEKQWGRSCEELPPEIIKRIPLRFTYDNNYFTSKYQMIPDDGYTSIIGKMIDHPEIKTILGCKIEDPATLLWSYGKLFYSGCIDALYDYKFGKLEYRCVTFKEKIYKSDNRQGNAVCNYTTTDYPYTRSIEHKWFNPGKECSGTVVSYEYPREWKRGMIPSYPVNTKENNDLYGKYLAYHNTSWNGDQVKLVGRLGKYKYMDMDKAILDALNEAKAECDRRASEFSRRHIINFRHTNA